MWCLLAIWLFCLSFSAQGESLLLEVSINEMPISNIARAEVLMDGRLALPLETWRETRLRIPGSPLLELPDMQRGYVLESIPGLRYAIDRQQLKLLISAPADAFQASAIQLPNEAKTDANPVRPGFYLNYDLSMMKGEKGSNNTGAFVEGVVFNQRGSLVSGAVFHDDGILRQTIRTETYWRKDMPERMESLLLGDAISSAGAWSRPVRYGGIRFARDFSLAPGYITYPMPSLSGSAALPSTIDLLINNQRRGGSLNINNGPFDLKNIPVISGSGEINLVVRDLRGVESVISQKYYLSPSMLAPGLSDFSFEMGGMRRNFGLPESDYGPGFASATYRYGLSPDLTGEGRIELQKTRQAAGVEFSGLLGTMASARAAVAWSQQQMQTGLPASGSKYLFGIERNAQAGGSLSLQYEYFAAGFSQFGSLANESRPRQRLQTAASTTVGGFSMGASFSQQASWDGDTFKLAAINLGKSIAKDVFLSLYLNKQLASDKGWSGGLSLILPLEKQHTVVVSSNRNNDGSFSNTAHVSQAAPLGPGWGWRVRASDIDSQLAQAGVTVNTASGQLMAEANASRYGNAYRVGANGSVGWLANMPFASRRIDHGAFAVVRVADQEGVPVYRSNQLAAKTNAQGLALITDLLPFQKNQLSLDPDELPLDMEIRDLRENVTPAARSGVLVNFQVKRTRNALLILQKPNGDPLPPGSRVSLIGSEANFVVGKRGEVYLRGLADKNHLQIKWLDGSCELFVSPETDGDIEARIGPLSCPASH